MLNSEDLGTLAICSLRYCVGRRTYMPSLVVDIVKKHWGEMKEGTREIIKRDLKEAIATRDLGDDCDIATWKEFAEWIEGKQS